LKKFVENCDQPTLLRIHPLMEKFPPLKTHLPQSKQDQRLLILKKCEFPFFLFIEIYITFYEIYHWVTFRNSRTGGADSKQQAFFKKKISPLIHLRPFQLRINLRIESTTESLLFFFFFKKEKNDLLFTFP
jgi:hypothetical protein